MLRRINSWLMGFQEIRTIFKAGIRPWMGKLMMPPKHWALFQAQEVQGGFQWCPFSKPQSSAPLTTLHVPDVYHHNTMKRALWLFPSSKWESIREVKLLLKAAHAEFRAELSAPESMPLTTGVYHVGALGTGSRWLAISQYNTLP